MSGTGTADAITSRSDCPLCLADVGGRHPDQGGTHAAAHGTLSLTTPWARAEFPDYAEREAIAARIPDGYTIRIVPKSDRSAFGVEVMEHGSTMSGNRVLTGRAYYRDVRAGVDAAIDWIDTIDLMGSTWREREPRRDAPR